MPADFAVSREDLDVVRIGEDVRLEGFELQGEGAVVATSLGPIEVNFTMRHLAENAVYALAAYRRARAAARAGGRGRLGDRLRRLAQPGARRFRAAGS